MITRTSCYKGAPLLFCLLYPCVKRFDQKLSTVHDVRWIHLSESTQYSIIGCRLAVPIPHCCLVPLPLLLIVRILPVSLCLHMLPKLFSTRINLKCRIRMSIAVFIYLTCFKDKSAACPPTHPAVAIYPAFIHF